MDKPKVKANATVSKSGCLRRSFNGKPIGVPMIKKILHHPAGSFAVFEKLVRISLHNSMHNEIGKASEFHKTSSANILFQNVEVFTQYEKASSWSLRSTLNGLAYFKNYSLASLSEHSRLLFSVFLPNHLGIILSC